MKTILYIALIFIPFVCKAQTETSIDKLINNLSWNSITCEHSLVGDLLNYSDPNVSELIKIGKSATESLLNSLGYANKTVIVHIILTEILEPENATDFLAQKYIYKDCDNLIGWHYTFNGIVWEWFSESNFSISDAEINKVQTYWFSRLIGKSQAWKPNTNKIFENLEESDSIKYPCNKIYKNNSENLGIDNVIKLLGTSYPSDEFKFIFDILGNDSTISKYKDCYFISFGADGIDFRFDIKHILTSIFIESEFKGDLPYGLNYSDTKRIIEKKIGEPNKKGHYADNEWVWYKDEKLYIDYNKNHQIIKFAISDQ